MYKIEPGVGCRAKSERGAVSGMFPPTRHRFFPQVRDLCCHRGAAAAVADRVAAASSEKSHEINAVAVLRFHRGERHWLIAIAKPLAQDERSSGRASKVTFLTPLGSALADSDRVI